MFNMAHPQFRKHLPTMISQFPHHPCEMAKGITDVAINQLFVADNDFLTGWNMLFQQHNYSYPGFEMHKKKLPREGGGLRLFGRVHEEKTLHCILQLSAVSVFERSEHIITLESV